VTDPNRFGRSDRVGRAPPAGCGLPYAASIDQP